MSNPSKTLGRLERVDLREAWAREAGDFTPWMAQPENLELLAEAIGLDLELQAREQPVGPFRADLLCRDAATDELVLVENQLEQTDHTHLGQIMTYAAGLSAATIVWVAPSFSAEHRAAIDWLNRITDERHNFFGLEIELWRINDSPPAPKFNIVAQPNEWSRTIEESARSGETSELTETRQLQLEYWTAFQQLLKSQGNPDIHLRRPNAGTWMVFSIGRSSFTLATFCNTLHNRIGISLTISGSLAKQKYKALLAQRAEIERDAGFEFNWLELPNRQRSVIKLTRQGADPENRNAWAEQHNWLAERLKIVLRVFKPRIGALNIEDDTPTDGTGTEDEQ
jgi:hypothetical protein